MSFLNDMVIFNELVKATYIELLQEKVIAFNEASGGTITMITGNEAIQGDFREESFYKQMGDLVRRRNPYSQGSISSVGFEMGTQVAAKIAAGTPVVEWTRAQFEWIKENVTRAATITGVNLAKQKFEDYFEQAVAIALAAMLNDAATIMHDVSGGSNTLTHARMTAALEKFGDAHQNITTWISHSTPMFDLYQANLGNSEQLFRYEGVIVRSDPFGNRMVMSDLTQLVDSGDYYLLGLTPNSVVVRENNDFAQETLPVVGSENLAYKYQAEWTYEVSVKGYSWDKDTGGAAPNDAALQSSANWNRIQTTTHKLLPGVILKVDG